MFDAQAEPAEPSSMSTSRLFLCLALSSATMAADLEIVPAVQSWKPAEGTLAAPRVALEVVPAHAAALKATASAITEDLTSLQGSDTTTGGGKPVTLQLSLEGGDPKRPEGYTVEISDKIVIRGATPAAVFLGSRSVLQLLRQAPVL